MKVIRLKCRKCGGSGETENPFFEACARMTKEEFEQYGMKGEGDCWECPHRALCDRGQIINCPQCHGAGTMEFTTDEWDWEIECTNDKVM